MATKHIAHWATNLEYKHLPAEVIEAAIKSFYNWTGCAIGGSDHEATRLAYKALSPFFGQPQAALLGSKSEKIDASHAALLNGIASHVHDYDDTHLDTIIHPTAPVASALLAIAEQRGSITGKGFLLALIAGIEVECKLGLAIWPEHYDVGWHITSTTGSIGAAVAIAKVLHFDEQRTMHAIGIAATQVTGLREMFGSHTKSFHPGRAAQNGLMAAVLAESGFTSSENAIEAKRGWANVVGVTKGDVFDNTEKWIGITGDVGLAADDGGRWEMLRNSFKPYPCGIVIHPVIDGCSQLHEEMAKQKLEVVDIDSVDIIVHPLVLELTGKKEPRDELQAKFSVYHGAAVGLLFGLGTPSQYQDEVVRSQDVVDLRKKITAQANKEIKPDETKITIKMKDGHVLRLHVEHAVGSLEVPLTKELLEKKFIDQCTTALGDNVERASKALWDLEAVKDMRDLSKLL